MSFSVGILYSVQEFVSLINSQPLAVEEFTNTFTKFSLARPEDIIYVATKCDWINFHPDGICRITEVGKSILDEDAEKSLRRQIRDLIFADDPTWAAKIPNGRKEVTKFFPDEVHQCFKEAGLLEPWNDEIVEWWDKLAIATRSQKSEASLITGRAAEKLTIYYEKERVGEDPHWQSIESNFSGYDVLSRSEKGISTRRMIEVKGSSLPRSQAFCTVTRNEWTTAESSEDYRFHLWCMKGAPFLIDVSVEDMKSHIPTDSGDGRWETVRVAFKNFLKSN